MILQSISDVYHVGTLTRESRYAKHSLEAMMLSVSLDPEDWAGIARCSGPTWVFSNPDAKYLDATSLTDDEVKDIEAWGLDRGLVEKSTIWKAWYYDSEADDWYYILEMDFEKASQWAEDTEEVGYDPDDIPSENGKALEEIDAMVLTNRGMECLERWSDREHGTDGLIILWAQHQAETGALPIVGVWWNEDHNPGSLSCPRGGIFPEFLSNFKVESLTGEPVPEGFGEIEIFPESSPSL